ncbi:EamA family transporter [Bacillus pacificus]
MKQTILGAICLSLAASIWGGMYVVSKYVLDFIPPLTLVWLRFIIAFVVLYMILKIAEKKQKKTVTIHKKIGSYSLGLDLSDISFRSLVNLSEQNYPTLIQDL